MLKARATKTYRIACGWIFVTAARAKAWVPGPVVVDVEFRAYRDCGGFHPRDEDNARASLKAAFDALKDAKVVRSDAKGQLRWGHFTLLTTEREVKRTGKNPGVTVTVRRV